MLELVGRGTSVKHISHDTTVLQYHFNNNNNNNTKKISFSNLVVIFAQCVIDQSHYLETNCF